MAQTHTYYTKKELMCQGQKFIRKPQ